MPDVDLTHDLADLAGLAASEDASLDDLLRRGLEWLSKLAPYDLACVFQLRGDARPRLLGREPRDLLELGLGLLGRVLGPLERRLSPLLAALHAGATRHQLQVVDDDHAELLGAGLVRALARDLGRGWRRGRPRGSLGRRGGRARHR